MTAAIQTSVLDTLKSAQDAATGNLNVNATVSSTAVTGSVSITTPTAKTVTAAAITVGTTAVRLTHDGSAPAATRVLLAVIPDSASTATYYIGPATVANSGANRGFQVVAGQPFIANNDAGDYYIISSIAAQTVYIMEQA